MYTNRMGKLNIIFAHTVVFLSVVMVYHCLSQVWATIAP